jgi:hypothetical protein
VSRISEQVKRLQTTVSAVIERKERLPHPLFWSLLHSEIGSIKRSRKAKRERLAKEFGIDWA